MVGILKILIPAIIASAATIPHAAQAQSFDCRKAKTDTEWAICNTPELRKLDEKVVSTYRGLITNPGSPPGLKAAAEQLQSSWLHWERDQCYGDVGCLINAYKKISDSLSNAVQLCSHPGSDGKTPKHCAFLRNTGFRCGRLPEGGVRQQGNARPCEAGGSTGKRASATLARSSPDSP